jgi:hypothetical protein
VSLLNSHCSATTGRVAFFATAAALPCVAVLAADPANQTSTHKLSLKQYGNVRQSKVIGPRFRVFVKSIVQNCIIAQLTIFSF